MSYQGDEQVEVHIILQLIEDFNDPANDKIMKSFII